MTGKESVKVARNARNLRERARCDEDRVLTHRCCPCSKLQYKWMVSLRRTRSQIGNEGLTVVAEISLDLVFVRRTCQSSCGMFPRNLYSWSFYISSFPQKSKKLIKASEL